jgi:hypothetical protein
MRSTELAGIPARQGETDDEATTATVARLAAHSALVLLCDLARYCEPKPGAPVPGLPGSRWPVEGLEDAFAFVLGYAWPTITDPDFDPSTPFAYTNLDRSATVAQGVLQQIAEQPSQQVRITP